MGVDVETVDGAAIVTLRWPERRNALGPGDTRLVADAITAASRTDVVALILTGEGAFCAGGDLRGFSELGRTTPTEEIRDIVYRDAQGIVRALWDSPVATIAAIDGAAIGLGMDLALACDMRFVGASGWMQQGWAGAGLIPAAGGAAMLQRLNPGVGWQLLCEQTRLSASACASLGLAELATMTALGSAKARTTNLAKLPADVRQAYVRLLRPLRIPAEEHLQACAELQARFIGSDRFQQLAVSVLGSP